MLSACPPFSKEEELHWIALLLVPGLGTRKASQLIERLRTPQAIFRASRAELEAQGLPGSVAQSVASGCTFEEAVEQQQKMMDFGAVAVPISDPRYPPRLREIFDPPVVLFAKGRLELLQTLMIAVVGTRRPTVYGNAATERLAGDLANAGLTIVSGMARGIDTAAHKSALAVGGNTIAVFGCGLDLVYPAENRKLSEELAEKALLVSEFPMSAPPFPQNFPIRYRIVSGMTLGVLVVEGAQYSGSGITAKLATDQGREVFAVPGNITSKVSWGPNLLIKQGAKLVQEWNDVVVELKPEDRRRLIVDGRNRLTANELNDAASSADAQASLPLGPAAGLGREILATLKEDAGIQLDTLLESLEGHSPSEVIAALFELEMLGLIRQLPGKHFVKIWAE
ncbi:MAG: DNA-processing protein DprA [Bryobacteraceae bacterium]